MTEGISQYIEKERKLPEVVHIGEFGTPELPFHVDIDSQELSTFLEKDLGIAPDEISKIKVQVVGSGVDEISGSVGLISKIATFADSKSKDKSTLGICDVRMVNGKRVVTVFAKNIYDEFCKHMGDGINFVGIPDKRDLGHVVVKDQFEESFDRLLLDTPVEKRLHILNKFAQYGLRLGVMDVMAHELKHAQQRGFSAVKDFFNTVILRVSPPIVASYMATFIAINALPENATSTAHTWVPALSAVAGNIAGVLGIRKFNQYEADNLEGEALDYGSNAVDKRLSNGMMNIVKVRAADVKLPI